MNSATHPLAAATRLTDLLLLQLTLKCHAVEIEAKLEVLTTLRASAHPVLAQHWCDQADGIFDTCQAHAEADLLTLAAHIEVLDRRIAAAWQRSRTR